MSPFHLLWALLLLKPISATLGADVDDADDGDDGDDGDYVDDGSGATLNPDDPVVNGDNYTEPAEVEDRIFRALIDSGYDTRFVSSSRRLISGLGLTNKRMVMDNSVTPTTETISWTQTSRCWWGCKEKYRLVDYYVNGDKGSPVYKVYIAKKYNPPRQFWTSGYKKMLHFGFLHFGRKQDAVFFVIHPNSWGPFQKRFKTNKFYKFLQKGFQKAIRMGTKKAFAAMGSIVPGLGTVIGKVIGKAAGKVTAKLGDSVMGDYLRYIG